MDRRQIVLAFGVWMTVSGCGLLNTTPVQPVTPSEPTEAEQAATSLPEVSSQTEAPTPAATPTEAPPLEVWPLSADLYYLSDGGQVWRQPRLGDSSTAVAITRPGLTVSDFDVAPGGDWLAYRDGGSILVSSVDGSSGQVINQEAGFPADLTQGQTIAWSPDGSKLAYVTDRGFQVYIPGAGEDFSPLIFDVGERSPVHLSWSEDSRWLLMRRSDTTMALYDSAEALSLWLELGAIRGSAWLRDNRLAFAPQEGGLALILPDDPGGRLFLIPQDQAVTLPVLTGEGQVRFFIHRAGIPGPGTPYEADPDSLAVDSLSQVQVDTSLWRWDPTGSRLISVTGSGPSLTLLDPFSGSQGRLDTSGSAALLDWGDPPSQPLAGVTLPADLFFIGLQAGVPQVWRLDAASGAVAPITATISGVRDFAVSPDGSRVAYTSGAAIYSQTISGGVETLVVELAEDVSFGAPSFSRDGLALTYYNRGIWITNITSGEPRRLIADDAPQDGTSERLIQLFTAPQWSPDGRWILSRVQFYEGYDLALIPVTPFGVAPTPTFLNTFGAEAVWTDSNRLVVFSAGGAYAEPTLTLVEPGFDFNDTPTIAPLFSLPVLNAREMPSGRIGILRVPAPHSIGPTSVRYTTIEPDGSDLQTESAAFVLNAPLLSPDGTFIVGLVGVRRAEDGVLIGQIGLVNLATGERYRVDDARGVSAVRWGR
jgi:Tol biopolymer transport system component